MHYLNDRYKNSLFYNTTLTAMQRRFNLDQQLIDDLYNEDEALFYVNAYYFADYFVSMTNIVPNFFNMDLNNKDDFILYVKMKIMYYGTMNDYLSVRK